MKGGALKKQAKTGAKGRPFEKIRRAPLEPGPTLWYDEAKRVEERKYPCPARPEKLRHRLKARFRGKRGEVPFGAAALKGCGLRPGRPRRVWPRYRPGKGRVLRQPAEFGWYREEVTSPLSWGRSFFVPKISYDQEGRNAHEGNNRSPAAKL